MTAAAVEKPGQEQQLEQVRRRHLVDLGEGPQTLLDGLGRHHVRVDALAVVRHLDDHLAAGVVGAQRQHAVGGLAGRGPFGGRLDAVVDGVADQVRQRVLDRLEQAAVELGVAADHLQTDLLAAGRREVAHHPRDLGPDVLDRLHARLHDAFLQLGGDQAEPLGGPGQVDVTVVGQPGDRVARQHQLADLAHQGVEQVDVDADRGVGRRAAGDLLGLAGDRLGGLARVGHLRAGSGRARRAALPGSGSAGSGRTASGSAIVATAPGASAGGSAAGRDAERFTVRLTARFGAGLAASAAGSTVVICRLLLGFCRWAGLRVRVGGRCLDDATSRRGLAGQHRLEAAHHGRDVDVALRAGALDLAEHLAHRVHHPQEDVGGRLVHRPAAVTQLDEQVLAHVGEALQLAEREEPARALDRVDRPEHAAQQLARAGGALERDQVRVELVEVLVTLHQELVDDVVQILHVGLPRAHR